MRVYGRVPIDQRDPRGPKRWVEVTTDANGFNDQVFLTQMAQVLQLNLNESPFYGDWGIPARQSVQQQIAPDIFVAQVQSRFAPRFASLIISKDQKATQPTYNVNALTHQGVALFKQVPI